MMSPPEFEPKSQTSICIEAHAVQNGFSVNVALSADRDRYAYGSTYVARSEKELRALLMAQATARIDEVMAHFKAAAKKEAGQS